MGVTEYRRLVSRIHRDYGASHNISRMGAAELADEVYWGRMTEDEVRSALDGDSTPINR